MKKAAFLLFIILAGLISMQAYSQDTISLIDGQADTIEFDTVSTSSDYDSESVSIYSPDKQADESTKVHDPSLALLFGGLAFLGLFFILCAALISLTVMSIVVLAGIGILTPSALSGLLKQSQARSFKMFFYLGNACVYAFIGGLAGFLTNASYSYAPVFFAIAAGIIIGVILSIPIGVASLSIMRAAMKRYTNPTNDL